ncbi:MAG TPA: GyrI-like domain-containing protein [Tepidiformaceae bacterium]|nr:GyrI-like domain-containing protein [Tepidiformaceae bacterium]
MPTTRAYTIEEVEMPATEGVGIRETVRMEDLPQFFGGAFGEIAQYIQEAGAEYTGPPFARYPSMPEGGSIDVEAVFPVSRTLEGKGRVRPVHLEATRAIQTTHTGPYSGLSDAYEALEAWVGEHHRAASDAPREVYLTGPEVPEEQHQTLVVQPIR